MFRIRLKECREKAGFSQYTFAAQFGVAQSTVGSWEAGKREPNFETLCRLAKFFNCSTDYLLGITDEPFLSKKDLPPIDGKPVSVTYNTDAPPSDEAMAVALEAAKKALKEFYNRG